MEIYDHIVVGAGSGGCIVAARLAAAGRTVLLLEAGPSDQGLVNGFWLPMPMGYGKSYYDEGVNWKYTSEPNPGLAGRRSYVPRGKVLGGSSSINAMVYSRGQASDFDGWRAQGNPGWGWDDVLPVYKRLENHAFGAGPWHGSDGPVSITVPEAQMHPVTLSCMAAAAELGVPRSRDLNGATIEGVGPFQITVGGGQRMSTSRAYLQPQRRNPNLRVLTEAHTTGIVLEGRRAVGVRYRRGSFERQARARAGVVLAAGAINTPQLLQLSGIGPGAVLREQGVPVLVDAPAVGEGLQDHICYDHVYRASVPSLNETLRPLLGRAWAGLQYLLLRKGPLAMSLNQGGGFYRSRPDVVDPDIQLYFCPLTYEKGPIGARHLMAPDPFPGFSLSISPCRPTSKGYVRIRSADPYAPPAIALNLLGTEEDRAIALTGARFLRQLAATKALSGIIAQELHPGTGTETDTQLLADLAARAYSVFHPSGSARMGPDPASAVVDARLRVHGVDGLSIADASVFPAITSGNTNAPAMLIGERAADFLLAGQA